MLIEPHRACEPGLLEVLLLPGFADAGGRWASARRPRAASQRSQTGVLSSQFRAAVGRASLRARPGNRWVCSLITPNKPSFWFGNPLGRAVASIGGGPTPRRGYDAGESAQQRLERALTYLHGLGLRADGDIATASAFHAVRHEASDGSYDRVLVLVRDRRASRWLIARLRRSLRIPADGPSEPPPGD